LFKNDSNCCCASRYFENAFGDECITSEPYTLTCSAIINHIIRLCDLPMDSIMVKYTDQQLWSTLSHVVSVGCDEVKKFLMVRKDGQVFPVVLQEQDLPVARVRV
jgi:hypothetical protein